MEAAMATKKAGDLGKDRVKGSAFGPWVRSARRERGDGLGVPTQLPVARAKVNEREGVVAEAEDAAMSRVYKRLFVERSGRKG
jgi:hypothetical protein